MPEFDRMTHASIATVTVFITKNEAQLNGKRMAVINRIIKKHTNFLISPATLKQILTNCGIKFTVQPNKVAVSDGNQRRCGGTYLKRTEARLTTTIERLAARVTALESLLPSLIERVEELETRPDSTQETINVEDDDSDGADDDDSDFVPVP